MQQWVEKNSSDVLYSNNECFSSPALHIIMPEEHLLSSYIFPGQDFHPWKVAAPPVFMVTFVMIEDAHYGKCMHLTRGAQSRLSFTLLWISFNSLTTDLCKKYKSTIILRGLRAVSDFEYEFQLAGMNRKLSNNIETVFLMSDVENQIISSKFVKEIIKLGGDIKKFTTKSTIKSLKKKYE